MGSKILIERFQSRKQETDNSISILLPVKKINNKHTITLNKCYEFKTSTFKFSYVCSNDNKL